MRAVHFLGGGRISLDDVPIPRPHGTEVQVRVKSASICGTDRENLLKEGQGTIPGHENAGIVTAVADANTIRVGERVAVNCHVTCGHCEHCRNGDLYLCRELRVIGFDRDGGYADYMLVPEACCTPLPDWMTFEQGALMVDMMGTPYRALRRARVTTGDTVGIWGAGPIGLTLLMMAQRLSARAAIMDTSDYRLDLARRHSPDLVLNPARDSVPGELHAWTRGCGMAAAFDCVGSEAVCRQAIRALAPRGKLVVVGVSRSLTLDPWQDLICNELTILGTRNFNANDFPDMVALVQAGLPLLDAVTHRFSLARAVEAFEVFKGDRCGKILIVDETTA